VDPEAGKSDQYLPGQDGARLQRVLSEQLEAVVEFADLCEFLTPSGSERPQRLIDLAQTLHDETIGVLQQDVSNA
jgi:hypothetical protein